MQASSINNNKSFPGLFRLNNRYDTFKQQYKILWETIHDVLRYALKEYNTITGKTRFILPVMERFSYDWDSYTDTMESYVGVELYTNKKGVDDIRILFSSYEEDEENGEKIPEEKLHIRTIDEQRQFEKCMETIYEFTKKVCELIYREINNYNKA